MATLKNTLTDQTVTVDDPLDFLSAMTPDESAAWLIVDTATRDSFGNVLAELGNAPADDGEPE